MAMRFEKSKEMILKFWIFEKQGFGLKRGQFVCGVSKTARDRFLREERKNKNISLTKRRYFLSSDYFKKVKEELMTG